MKSCLLKGKVERAAQSVAALVVETCHAKIGLGQKWSVGPSMFNVDGPRNHPCSMKVVQVDRWYPCYTDGRGGAFAHRDGLSDIIETLGGGGLGPPGEQGQI